MTEEKNANCNGMKGDQDSVPSFAHLGGEFRHELAGMLSRRS